MAFPRSPRSNGRRFLRVRRNGLDWFRNHRSSMAADPRFMRIDYYADYYEFENHNWWFVSRRRILRSLLERRLPADRAGWRVLDAGCGTGINLGWLRGFGETVGVDGSEEAIRFCHMRNETGARLAWIESLPFGDGTFHLATALDVLEHIEDDAAAMRELARVCAPGGYILVTVPVFPSLWSEHDEINQHVRRYVPSRLYGLFAENRLEIAHRSFMNTWLLPAAFVWRWHRNLRRLFAKPEAGRPARADNMHHVPWMNRLLTAIYSSERPLVAGPGLPVGLSLVALARKNAAP